MATWSYEENFETFSAGSLNGPGGWGAPTAGDPQIATDQPVNGGKSIKYPAIAANSGGNTKSITACDTDGSICYVSISTDDITTVDNGGIQFNDGTTFVFYLWANYPLASNLALASSLGNVVIANMTINTPHRIGIEFDFTNDRVRATFDGTGPSAWRTCDAFTKIDTLKTNANQGDGDAASIWVDNFSATSALGGGSRKNRLATLGVG